MRKLNTMAARLSVLLRRSASLPPTPSSLTITATEPATQRYVTSRHATPYQAMPHCSPPLLCLFVVSLVPHHCVVSFQSFFFHFWVILGENQSTNAHRPQIRYARGTGVDHLCGVVDCQTDTLTD